MANREVKPSSMDVWFTSTDPVTVELTVTCDSFPNRPHKSTFVFAAKLGDVSRDQQLNDLVVGIFGEDFRKIVSKNGLFAAKTIFQVDGRIEGIGKAGGHGFLSIGVGFADDEAHAEFIGWVDENLR